MSAMFLHIVFIQACRLKRLSPQLTKLKASSLQQRLIFACIYKYKWAQARVCVANILPAAALQLDFFVKWRFLFGVPLLVLGRKKKEPGTFSFKVHVILPTFKVFKWKESLLHISLSWVKSLCKKASYYVSGISETRDECQISLWGGSRQVIFSSYFPW